MKKFEEVLLPKIKKIHESIPTDILGGSQTEKCLMMAYLFVALKLKTYVEIGVYRGKSLFTVGEAVKYNGGRGYGIDPYLGSCLKEDDATPEIKKIVNSAACTMDFEQLYASVKEFSNRNDFDDTITLIRDMSENAYPYFQQNSIFIDMLHIDGNHDTQYVQKDVDNYLPLVAEGGLIVFDDIDWDSVRVVYDNVKQLYPLLYETTSFGILVKTPNDISRYGTILSRGISLFYEQLYCAHTELQTTYYNLQKSFLNLEEFTKNLQYLYENLKNENHSVQDAHQFDNYGSIQEAYTNLEQEYCKLQDAHTANLGEYRNLQKSYTNLETECRNMYLKYDSLQECKRKDEKMISELLSEKQKLDNFKSQVKSTWIWKILRKRFE